VIFKHVKVS